MKTLPKHIEGKPANPKPVSAGDIVGGKYRVEHVLGEGGMGIVVAARHLELKELYAIKVMKREALGGDAFAERRFIAEARAAARLKGEHVARVHDIGRLDTGELYMVMEHLKGTDLKKVVRTRGRLPLQEAITYVLQTCEAIAEAHALDIIHRDIKPHNLFLIEGANSIKVLDFGISKQATAEGPDITGTHVVLGTLSYMAPEQMEHSKRVDARSDVWSIGVVLYELVTGEIPFPGQGLLEIFTQVSQREARPPSQLQPGLPTAVDAVVARCLQRDPAQRFGSVNELALALRSLSPSPSAGAVRSIAPSSPVAGAAAAPQPALADAAFSVDSPPPTSSVSEARTKKRRNRSIGEKPAPTFHLTEVPKPPEPSTETSSEPTWRGKPPEPRTETSGGTTLPVKASTHRTRLRWGLAIGFGACGLVVLALVSLQSRQLQPAPTSQTSQEAHEAGSAVVEPRREPGPTGPRLEAKPQAPGPSANQQPPSAPGPNAPAQRPGEKKQENIPGGKLRPRSESHPKKHLLESPPEVKAKIPQATDNEKNHVPCIKDKTICTDPEFACLVDMSDRTPQRRSQVISESICSGGSDDMKLCCVRSKID